MYHAIKFLSESESEALYRAGKTPVVILSPNVQNFGRLKISSLAYRLPTGEQGTLAFRIYSHRPSDSEQSFDHIVKRFVLRFGRCLVKSDKQAALWYLWWAS